MNNKKCPTCEQVKPLEGGYYRAGDYYQKNCKLCHNAKRQEYPLGEYKYVKRPKGFDKLPKEKQRAIQQDIADRVNFKVIGQKHNIPYPTILLWNKKGIPPLGLSPIYLDSRRVEPDDGLNGGA